MSWWSPLVGCPYENGARGPAAFDCWGLVHFAYRQNLGLALCEYSDVSAHDVMAVARRMERPGCEGPWRPVQSDVAPFDVMVATARPGARRAGHVGLMLDARRVLHVWEATNVCVMPIDHAFLAGRVLGIWRHRDLC